MSLTRATFILKHKYFGLILKRFLFDRGSFCGATGTLGFGLRMNLLPVGFKVRVDSSSPMSLLSLVLNDPQSHLWLLRLGIESASLTPEASAVPLHQPL